MKCADLGHLSSAKEVHLRWVRRLEEEVSAPDWMKAQPLGVTNALHFSPSAA